MNPSAPANALLADGELPDFPTITPAQVLPAIETTLADYQSLVDRLVADPSARDFDRLIAPLERMEERLGRAFAPVSHLHGVKDSPELREAYSAALEKITEHGSALGQNRGLFEAVRAVHASQGFQALDRAQQTLIEDSLRNFRLSGVALEEPARTRFREIQNQLSKVQTGFEEAVLDATDAWTRPVSEAELAGLPPSARAMLAQAAASRQQDGFLATLKGPVVQAILTFADDRAAARDLYAAYNTRASDQGPMARRFDNSERIERDPRAAARSRAAARLQLQRGAVAGRQDGRLAGPGARLPARTGRKARPVARANCRRCATSPPPNSASPTCSPGTSAMPARSCASAATIFPKKTSSRISRCPR